MKKDKKIENKVEKTKKNSSESVTTNVIEPTKNKSSLEAIKRPRSKENSKISGYVVFYGVNVCISSNLNDKESKLFGLVFLKCIFELVPS
jgi:hypothetical protein